MHVGGEEITECQVETQLRQAPSSVAAILTSPTERSFRLVGVDDDAAGIPNRRVQGQRRALRKDLHSFADRHRIDKEIQLVDQAILDERGDEGRSAIHDDVLSRLTLEAVDSIDDGAVFHAHILAFDFLDRLAEYDLRHTHHLLAEFVFGALRLCYHIFPVLDEPLGHFSTEQDGVTRVGQMIDEGEELLIHVEGHPIQLSLWAGDKTVDRDLHLQLELSHGFSPRPLASW